MVAADIARFRAFGFAVLRRAFDSRPLEQEPERGLYDAYRFRVEVAVLRGFAYAGYTVQTGVLFTLTLLLASCGPVEVAKQSRAPGAPDDAPRPQAKPDATAPRPAPASEQADPADQREAVLREWLEQATQDCDSKRDPEAYLPLREGVSKESVALVKARCMEVAEVALRGEAWRRALSACVDRFVKANGAGKPPACRIAAAAAPEVPPSLLESHVASCTAVCAQAGPEALELKNERSKPVICCDGTRSPTCTYGDKSLLGCCSGHRGVCIE